MPGRRPRVTGLSGVRRRVGRDAALEDQLAWALAEAGRLRAEMAAARAAAARAEREIAALRAQSQLALAANLRWPPPPPGTARRAGGSARVHRSPALPAFQDPAAPSADRLRTLAGSRRKP